LAVNIGEHRWDLAIGGAGPIWEVMDGKRCLVLELDWQPGERSATAKLQNMRRHVLLSKTSMGFRLRYRGADLDIKVLPRHTADLLRLMPVKLPPDMSRYLLCPMPGQVVRLDVAEGDIVEAGQPLAVVEAMKMENVLKAEKRARVVKVLVTAGAVLAVDQVMVEFGEV
jgi:propionyl-CoA carboxylase alpha chain